MKQTQNILHNLSKGIPWLVFLFVATFGLTGCEKDYVYIPKLDVTTPVSYAADIQPIWNASCAGGPCHDAGSIDPDLTTASSYNALMTGGYVDTVNAASSILYVRMTDSNDPMPPGGLLTATETNKVLAWIEQGAKNN